MHLIFGLICYTDFDKPTKDCAVCLLSVAKLGIRGDYSVWYQNKTTQHSNERMGYLPILLDDVRLCVGRLIPITKWLDHCYQVRIRKGALNSLYSTIYSIYGSNCINMHELNYKVKRFCIVIGLFCFILNQIITRGLDINISLYRSRCQNFRLNHEFYQGHIHV